MEAGNHVGGTLFRPACVHHHSRVILFLSNPFLPFPEDLEAAGVNLNAMTSISIETHSSEAFEAGPVDQPVPVPFYEAEV